MPISHECIGCGVDLIRPYATWCKRCVTILVSEDALWCKKCRTLYCKKCKKSIRLRNKKCNCEECICKICDCIACEIGKAYNLGYERGKGMDDFCEDYAEYVDDEVTSCKLPSAYHEKKFRRGFNAGYMENTIGEEEIYEAMKAHDAIEAHAAIKANATIEEHASYMVSKSHNSKKKCCSVM